MTQTIVLNVNDQERTIDSDPQRPLLEVLREDFGLIGSKYGCGEGECGACTVHLGGVAIRSCITPVGQCDGESVRTIEGIAKNGRLHAVQQAFLDCQAMQCGYCIPGQIMTAIAFVEENPTATRDEIVEAMSDHICRCCNYPNILAAVVQAVGQA